MSDINIPKRDLGETPATPDISSLTTANTQPIKGALSIGGIQVINPTKKEEEGAFAKAINKEYNDANMYK